MLESVRKMKQGFLKFTEAFPSSRASSSRGGHGKTVTFAGISAEDVLKDSPTSLKDSFWRSGGGSPLTDSGQAALEAALGKYGGEIPENNFKKHWFTHIYEDPKMEEQFLLIMAQFI